MSERQFEPVEQDGVVYVPISIDAVRVDSVPEFDIYFQPGVAQPFVLYCEHNTPFTETARKRLEDNRVFTIYFQQADRKKYHRYIADHLETILEDPDLSPKKKAGILYDSAQAVVEEVLLEPGTPETVNRGKRIVEHTVEFMTAPGFMLEHLLRTISADAYLYTHSVNVVAYSVALALRSGYEDPASLRELANGALLHDVGKSSISPDVLYKPGPLTSSEWDLIRAVPENGYGMLREAGCLGEIALDIVRHHHERLDGSGYPDKLQGNRISRFVRIVSIADIFDALTSDRHHQKGKSTFEALRLMNNTMGETIDPELFRGFVEIMGNRPNPSTGAVH